jgi:hypothetical protein
MIITRLAGGMGNQMFEYALGRALSLKYGVPLLLDVEWLLDRTPRPARQHFVFRDYDLHIFNIEARLARRDEIPFRHRLHFRGTLKLALDRYRRRIGFPGLEKSFTAFDPSVLELGPDAYLEGYWQSPKYFAGYEDVIRKDFTLVNGLSERGAALQREIASTGAVCVNVRRGDFVVNPFHGLMGTEYFDQGIEHLRRATDAEKIYVFSDDVQWCEENLRFPLPTTFVGHEYKGEKFGEYLALMTACRHFVIPNSSFGFWAAWLSPHEEKTVIAPKQWFSDPSIDTRDLIPESWARM